MRILKWLGWIVGGFIGLLLIGVVALVLLFDPNDYKPQIEQLVKDQTGREFTLDGELKLSFFPWLAVQTGAASLGNAPGYGDTPMVAINGARLGIKLLPALQGRFDIGAVELDAPRIALITTAEGNNWSDLGSRESPETPGNDTSSNELNASIASLSIKNGSVSYEDRAAGSTSTLSNVNLSTGKLSPGEPFDFKLAFDLLQHSAATDAGAAASEDTRLSAELTSTITANTKDSVYTLNKPSIAVTLKQAQSQGQAQQPVTITASRIVANTATSDYSIDSPALTTSLTGESYPKDGLPVSIKADHIGANTETQLAEIKALLIDAAGAQLRGELQATQIIDNPAATGTLQLARISPRQLMKTLAIDVPNTADSKVLQSLTMSTGLKATRNSVELQPLTLQLDDTTLTGSVAIADLEAMALRFDLSGDTLNADRYMEPETEPAPTAPADTTPTPIDVAWLKDLDLSGSLKFKQLTVKQFPLTQLATTVVAKDQQLRVAPLQATLYEGKYQGTIALNAQKAVPVVSLDQQMQGINFAPLFKTLFDIQKISGKGTLAMKLTGSGKDTAELKRALNGTMSFSVADGALEGFDLWYEIRRARAVLKQQTVPERTGATRTAFTSLSGTSTVTNGKLHNPDLVAALQYMKVTGLGDVNLGNDTVDYQLNATVMKIPAEDKLADQTQDLSGLTIPVRISGALADPKIRPDVQGLLKEKAKQKLEEEKDKLIDKTKEKLQNKLKGLFGGG